MIPPLASLRGRVRLGDGTLLRIAEAADGEVLVIFPDEPRPLRGMKRWTPPPDSYLYHTGLEEGE